MLISQDPVVELVGLNWVHWSTIIHPQSSGIAFPLLYFNADTLITDFVYALFDLVQPMFQMERFLESTGKRFLSPRKPWNLVFARPGKSI